MAEFLNAEYITVVAEPQVMTLNNYQIEINLILPLVEISSIICSYL